MAYEKDGIEYPRCTEIISDCTNKSGGLVQWAANQAVEWIRDNCDEVQESDSDAPLYLLSKEDLELARFAYKDTSKTALDVGSQVHQAIEDFLSNKQAVLTSEQAEKAFEAFLDWKAKNKLEPIALEQTVYGDRWAGTLDYYGYYKGKLCVIDWKTSKAFYPEMRYQVAAYRSCTDGVEGCGVLMLDKETGMPKFHDTSKTYVQDLKVFNAMVELYYLRHPRIRKRFEKEGK